MDQREALDVYRSARTRLTDEPLSPLDLVRFCEALAGFAAGSSLGFLADPLMEARLSAVAVRPAVPAGWPGRALAQPHRILHYATRTYRIGGHSRLMAHWINADAGRSHDLILRDPSEMPRALIDALARVDGERRVLQALAGADRFAQARVLRDLAGGYDAVVLHAHPDDVVPTLAFAAGAPCPVILNNHVDHGFWLGSGLGDAVVCARAEAVEMCTTRRGIPPERCVFQPWPMPDLERHPVFADRVAVRAGLGLRPRTRIVLTAAHTWKFVSENDAFFSAFDQFLAQRPDTVLCVVGASAPELKRKPQAGGILFPGAIEELEALYVASDVFVDSYPVFTGLAMLEAFAHGLPVLSTDLSERIPGRPGLEQPGLPRHLFHHPERDGFFAALGRLLDSPEEREAQRLRLSGPFNAVHAPDVVRRGLDTIYRLAADHFRRNPPTPDAGADANAEEHLDVRPTELSRFYQKTLTLAGLAPSQLDLPPHLAEAARPSTGVPTHRIADRA